MDFDFIKAREGNDLTANVPDPKESSSGTTIASGVDLGQMSEAEIRAMPIPDDLKNRLAPYAGKIKDDAVTYLNEHPLAITAEEAEKINEWKLKEMAGIARRNFEAESGDFGSLPQEAQTVLTAVAYQYPSPEKGEGPGHAPIFWSAVKERRWDDALAELRKFNDRYQPRHDEEANLLEQAIKTGKLPTQ